MILHTSSQHKKEPHEIHRRKKCSFQSTNTDYLGCCDFCFCVFQHSISDHIYFHTVGEDSKKKNPGTQSMRTGVGITITEKL